MGEAIERFFRLWGEDGEERRRGAGTDSCSSSGNLTLNEDEDTLFPGLDSTFTQVHSLGSSAVVEEPAFDQHDPCPRKHGSGQVMASVQKPHQKSRKMVMANDTHHEVCPYEWSPLKDMLAFFSQNSQVLRGKGDHDLTQQKKYRILSLSRRLRELEKAGVVYLSTSGPCCILGISLLLVLNEETFEEEMITFANVQALISRKNPPAMRGPMKATCELFRQCGLMKVTDKQTNSVRYEYNKEKMVSNSRLLFSRSSSSKSV
eukprot:754795-Hanusia_phi.AAC.2